MRTVLLDGSPRTSDGPTHCSAAPGRLAPSVPQGRPLPKRSRRPAVAFVSSDHASVDGFAVSCLAGGTVLRQKSGSCAVLPLLGTSPLPGGLPFAAALELHAPAAQGSIILNSNSCTGVSSSAASGRLQELEEQEQEQEQQEQQQQQLEEQTAPTSGQYQLRFVLGGSGQLHSSTAGAQSIRAGDSILSTSRAARLSATEADPPLWPGQPWQLAVMVLVLPPSLMELPPQQQAEGQGLPQQEQGRRQDLQQEGKRPGYITHDDAAQLERVQQGWLTGRPCGALSAGQVQSLLLGAQELARSALPGERPAGRGSGDGSSSGGGGGGSGSEAGDVAKKSLDELPAYQLPNQTNRLAIAFDPYDPDTPAPFVFGVEVFEPGHRTQPHVHPQAHELFFILAGKGSAFCGDARFPVSAGDALVFKPGAVHGIDNTSSARLFCLEMMAPNEEFAERVRQGRATGSLAGDELCLLTRHVGCPGA